MNRVTSVEAKICNPVVDKVSIKNSTTSSNQSDSTREQCFPAKVDTRINQVSIDVYGDQGVKL